MAETRWQSWGNLNNGRNAGPWYANLNNTMGNTNWNISSRQSENQTKLIPIRNLVSRHDYHAPRLGGDMASPLL